MAISNTKLSGPARKLPSIVLIGLTLHWLSAVATPAQQWQVHTLSLKLSNTPQQPTDTPVTVSWTHEEDGELETPGFWNDNNEYLVRFAPPQPGQWSYEVNSPLAELDGVRGSIRVLPPESNNHGGVIISEEAPTRFRHQDGTVYYPIAFECDWLFALDAENGDDTPTTRHFVDQLATNGFNQVVMNVFAYDVTWKKDDRLQAIHEYGSPNVFPFKGNNETPQHEHLNIEYFQRLDRVIELLNERNIVAHLMIYVWNKRVNWPDANSEADNRYFDYVVKRYQAYPNIVWDISKEALGYGHTDVHYITDRIHRLRKLDTHQRLVTVHDYGYCRRFPEEVDFVSAQLWSSELYSVMRHAVTAFPNKPILNIEHGGYERSPYVVFVGNYDSPEVCLERAYQCVFAGTYPTHYWQGAAWNVIIPNPEQLPEEERPRLRYYRHLKTLVEDYQLDQLIAGEKKSASGFCLHNGSNRYVYYVPKENARIDIRLPREFQGQTMKAVWFDPFTGEYQDPIMRTIPRWPAFAKPQSDGFKVLIVDVLDN